MKRNLLFLLNALFCILPLSACASGDSSSETKDTDNIKSDSKTLVVYFSCTNTTKAIADKITNILSADEFRIEPTIAYTSADLNYNDNNCRANQEQNNDNARPAMAKGIDNVSDYDVIYVGFPIWWGKMPKIMFTFFDSYDFKGKTIIPFCTSGSSGISTAMSEIRALEPNAIVKDGRRFASNASENTIKSWIESVQATDISSISIKKSNQGIAYNLREQVVDNGNISDIDIMNGKKYISKD